MKGGGQRPEDVIVEDPRWAQYLQRADFLGGNVLEEAREDLVLGDKSASRVATDPLVGVDGQVQIEGEARACVCDEPTLGRVRHAPGLKQFQSRGHRQAVQGRYRYGAGPVGVVGLPVHTFAAGDYDERPV